MRFHRSRMTICCQNDPYFHYLANLLPFRVHINHYTHVDLLPSCSTIVYSTIFRQSELAYPYTVGSRCGKCINNCNNGLCGKCNTISIYHECEGGIEKSVPRITDWHHEACKVIRRNGFFYSILTRIMDSFSCSPLNT